MPTTWDPATALVVVDVQNDFADPDGRLYVPGGDEVIPAINDAVRSADEARATIVYTQDWHPEVTPHFEKDGGIWPVHCVKGTWGAALHPDLVVIPGPVIRKGVEGEDGYSAFTVRDPETGEEDPTDLDGVLRERGIERVVIVGLAQDVCVRASALDAVERGYDTVVLRHATAPVEREPGDGDRANDEMVEAGVTLA
ncbi:MAG: isochorismatase family protein [Actinobacteria bacterium]|nr:isochorismatase family protein [Actinomycetota bacterium]